MTTGVWRALGLPPLAYLCSPWPWRALCYLLTGVLVGLLPIVAGVTAYAASRTYVSPVVGAPLSVGLALATCLVIPVLEPVRSGLVDPEGAVGRGQPARSVTARRGLVLAVLTLVVLCWVDTAVLVTTLGVPVLMVAARLVEPGATWAYVMGGLLLLPVTAYLLGGWAGTRAQLAQAVLGPSESDLAAELGGVVASRARLSDAFEAERRRIERDLHDGAQRRLVAVRLAVGLAQLECPPSPKVHEQLDEAQELLLLALVDLRRLIAGVQPPLLAERGLAAALADVGRGLTPTTSSWDLPHRLPQPVESAAYFCVSEAISNVNKHSGATRVHVEGRLRDGLLVIEVSDDGCGGADASRGTGLTGLADRLAVVGGRLRVQSPVGGPTVVRLEVPCPSSR